MPLLPSCKLPLTPLTLKPGRSSSKVVTVTVWVGKAVKSASEAVLTATVIELCWLPSSKTSSTLFKVIVWVTFQLLGLKVKLPVATLTSVRSKLLMSKITFVAGSAVSTAVKLTVSLLPSWRSPPVNALNTKPATSLSALPTTKLWSATDRKAASELASIDKVMVDCWVPSRIKSSMLFRVMVWLTFQLPLVKV